MQVTIVGASGSVSGPLSPASSYLVQAPYQDRTFSLLLDLGPGAFGALYRYLDPAEVDAVALSHLHPDHCLDLCGLYVAGRYAPTSPWRRIPVYGPTGTAARVGRAYEVDGTGEPGLSISEWFDYREWGATQHLGPFIVSAVRVAHPVEAYAIKVVHDAAGGGILVFTGDTGPTPVLDGFARDADLLLAEAAFLTSPDNPPDLHLTGAEAARVAERAGAGLLVLTHIPPWHDPERVRAEARAATTRPVELAVPGARWNLGRAQ
ncbi:MAG: MBL fold metallo-hydrolase [Microlunatus sp.]|nr:MBL fold metallo-hydrolase [Microlunatus sp.]MDN5805220.1 MBL fold metallo-hydrolase [Microlunatus sp.]